MIDLTALNNAISQLRAGLMESRDSPTSEIIRDGVIQRFEYTYELCHKMLKRYLLQTEPNPVAIDEMSFPDLIRTAWNRKLLMTGWDGWELYRRARGTTSHTYDRAKASEVFNIIPRFLMESEWLYDRLTERLNAKI